MLFRSQAAAVLAPAAMRQAVARGVAAITRQAVAAAARPADRICQAVARVASAAMRQAEARAD